MSFFTLINQTHEHVHLALFRRPAFNPTVPTIAWRIAMPPPQGQQSIEFPRELSVRLRYATDPEQPGQLDASVASAAFSETTAEFVVASAPAPDGRAEAMIAQRYDDLRANLVRVINRHRLGVEAAICCDGDALYLPQAIWPDGVLLEDVRGALQVAVVSPYTVKGQRLLPEEVAATQFEARPGGAWAVSGSMWTGYRLDLAG